MSQIRDVVARMAVDPAFAEQVRTQPGEVAQQYGLSSEELETLRGLANAQPDAGPVALGARVSKSGIGTGGLAGLFAVMADAPPIEPVGGQSDPIPPSALFAFNPQPEPPGDPFAAEVPEKAGFNDSGDVGYYPWPNIPGGDPFAGEAAGLGGPDTAPAGPSAPGEDAGIIVIGGTPDPGGPSTPGEAEGIVIVGGTPDPGGPSTPGEAEGIIIVNSQPDPAEADAGQAPGEAQGIIIIGGQPDPAQAEADAGQAPGKAEGIIIVDSQPDPAQAEGVKGVEAQIPGSAEPLLSEEPFKLI